jgi:hypothetical protein
MMPAGRAQRGADRGNERSGWWLPGELTCPDMLPAAYRCGANLPSHDIGQMLSDPSARNPKSLPAKAD